MAITFEIDQRGLPGTFDGKAQAAFIKVTKSILEKDFGLDNNESNKHVIGVVIGALLNQGYYSTDAPDYRTAIELAWRESLGQTINYKGDSVANREIYDFIVTTIPKLAERNLNGGGAPKIFYQELALVADYVIQNAKTVPLGHPNFVTQIRIGLDKYVAGLPPGESLSISLALGDGGRELSIEPENIRAVGTILFGYNCEKMRLFDVTDRVTELFMHGLLPVGYDSGGKLLDSYYWDAEDRLNASARNMIYSRVLGVAGGDVSRDVQPNKDFDTLYMRFLASLSEYDRQQRVTDLFESARGGSLRLTAEQVRKTGRDLAANASLYGWGGTQFAARRIKDQVLRCFDILKNPIVQRAYGVSNAYQVIERVSMNEFGQSPNIVKHKTMADAGIGILEIVARRSNAWSTSSARPLFPSSRPGDPAGVSDIPAEDQEVLMLQAQNWLSVNGIQSDAIGKMSEPSDTRYAPSMPAFGAVNPSGSAPGGDIMEKIQKMVSSGSAPSLDQLQQLLPSMK